MILSQTFLHLFDEPFLILPIGLKPLLLCCFSRSSTNYEMGKDKFSCFSKSRTKKNLKPNPNNQFSHHQNTSSNQTEVY